MYSFLKRNVLCPIIWFGFEDYGFFFNNYQGNLALCNNVIDKTNLNIVSMLQNSNDIFIDTKRIIAELGIQNAYDLKNKYRWNIPYSSKMIESIVKEIYKQYKILIEDSKKCIILDCDNVLWGGTLIEDGIENIKLGNEGLGRLYQDFQRYLVWFYYHGVILAICSKNSIYDVKRMFNEHRGMILHEEHIAHFQVNWDSKVNNVNILSNILNIDISSMVFIDDTEYEVTAIKAAFPDITTILFNYKLVYEQLSCFYLKASQDIVKIKQRIETYQSEEQRKQLFIESIDVEKYIENLEVEIDIHQADKIEFARISELTLRTNKCTNGKRYTVSDLEEVIEKNYNLYSVYVKDKFSDLGLVGTIGINNSCLDLFSLSCRAFGRNVEKFMLDFAFKDNITEFEFFSTSKNLDIEHMLCEMIKK